MRNEVIFDDRGNPDIMVAFTPDELGLPAELKGRQVAEYLIGKYQATVIDGRPYSMPYQKPAVDINHDEAIRLCESKGPGWHLITNDEWAALARQSWKNDTMPTGNTNGGKSHSHPEQTGTTYEGSYGKTLTGSGPVEWNHDRTAEGVADMCGNVWEHVGGIRFLNGQVQVIPDNGAAAGADQSADSPGWTTIYTSDGDPVYYNVHDGEIALQSVESSKKGNDGVPFTDLEGSMIDVPDKLIELGLYPEPGYESEEYFWLDTDGERCVYRGGLWASGANAGVFYLNGDSSRSNSSTNIGFRPAFVRYSGDLDHLDGQPDDLSDAPEELKQQIKDNAEKLERKEAKAENAQDRPYHLPDTLPGMIRLALAKVLTDIYTAAGGQDALSFQNTAYNATDDEIKETVLIASQLAQLNIAAEAMRRGMDQVKLATTMTMTIGKEAADHE